MIDIVVGSLNAIPVSDLMCRRINSPGLHDVWLYNVGMHGMLMECCISYSGTILAGGRVGSTIGS